MIIQIKLIRLIVICMLIASASGLHAEEENKNQPVYSGMQNMTPEMMNQMMGMMNPNMYMNMMYPMMNPSMYMNMMNPMMGMMNPMMGMMNPMMGMMNPMTMMGPMMGMGAPMMGSMMNPMGMMGGMGMQGANPMAQMPAGQMMDPKQYEQMFNQWTEMMKNFTAQAQAQAQTKQ